ncbi:hypothetical protein LBMAG27_22770 [Bacteroidota bacterium]|nr:hypothetical protein LBMAG27_22770 [Bacteroidota bacterium]
MNIKLKIFFTFILLLTITQFVNAEWVWTKKASLPFGCKRDRAVSFSINGFGYLGTGLDSANMVRTDFWKYDTLTDSWSQVADFPGTARRDAVAFVIDSFAYVGTGIDDSSAWGTIMSDFYRYDASLNNWIQIDSMGSGLSYGVFKAASFSVGGKGYVSTGRVWGAPVSETWMYDPGIDTWTQKMNFPMFGGRNGAVAFAIGTKAYLTTGSDDNYFFNDLWEYDATLDAWSQKQNFPGTARIASVAFTLDTIAFVGTGSDGGYTNDFWYYNPNSNQWNYANQFPGDARRGASVFTLYNYGYLACGKSAFGTKRDLWQLAYKAQEPPNSVQQFSFAKTFSVYPNIVSVNSFIQLNEIPEGNFELKIFDSSGKLIDKTSTDKKNIFMSGDIFKTSGEYFIQLKSSNRNLYSPIKKIMVL